MAALGDVGCKYGEGNKDDVWEWVCTPASKFKLNADSPSLRCWFENGFLPGSVLRALMKKSTLLSSVRKKEMGGEEKRRGEV